MKQRKIRQNCSKSDREQDDSPCGARPCLLEDTETKEAKVVWAECGQCSVWSHAECVLVLERRQGEK